MPTYLADNEGNFTPEVVRAKASFVVLSDDLSPEAMTDLLRVTPDKAWHIGDSRRGGKAQSHNGWEVDSRLPEDQAPEAHLADLLERIAPIADAVARLATNPSVFRVSVWLVRYGQNFNPGLSLSADSIRRLAELGTVLEIDVYVSETDENESQDAGQSVRQALQD